MFIERMPQGLRRGLVAVVGCLAGFWCEVSPVAAAAPHPRDVLPIETQLYVSCPSIRDLKTSWPETALGQMLQDPALKPLADKLYQAGINAVDRFREQIGLPAEELLKLPDGQITLAAFPAEKSLAVVVLWDVGENRRTAERLIERAIAALKENGKEPTEETIEGEKALIFGDGGSRFGFLWKDSVLCIGNSAAGLKVVSKGFGDGLEGTLAGNRPFTAIMKRCEDGEVETPHLEWFFDPIAMLKFTGEVNPGAQLAIAALPVLGLDGLQGIGGTITMATPSFDSVIHTHLLLDSVRTGVLEALALEAGEMTPEPWVPADVTQYSTLHWNATQTFDTVAKLYDSFQGDGSFRRLADRGTERFEFRLETDVLPMLHGRFSYLVWTEPPVRPESQSIAVAARVRDVKQATAFFDKMLEKFPDAYEKKTFAGTDYWYFKDVRGPRNGGMGFRGPRRFRPDQAPPEGEPAEEPTKIGLSICFVGDRVIASDRPGMIEHILRTHLDGKGGLANALDYKLMSARMMRAAGEQKVGLLTFNRPERELEFVYDLANSAGAREGLARTAERNDFLRDVQKSLDENPLPPFETLRKYFAPSGSMITQDALGFHYVNYVQRRKREQ